MGKHHLTEMSYARRPMSLIIGELPCGPEGSREAQIRSAYYLDSYYDTHQAKHRREG